MTFFRIYFRRRAGQSWPRDTNTLLVHGKDELERILGRKTPIAVAWERAKLHKCAGCRRRGPWDRNWRWRGSWGAIESDEPIECSCSSACCEKLPRIERQHWIGYEPLRARERAKRKDVGMSETDRQALTRARRSVPLPDGWKGPGQCRWCLGKIEDKRAPWMNWHRDCKRIWLLHSDRDYQARFLIARDGNDCWDCRRGGRWKRIDLVLPKYRWEGWATGGPIPKIDYDDRYPELDERKVEGVIVGLYSSVHFERVCGGLEVDHDVPLWSVWNLPDDERKPFYGPTNIRLRCDPCHKAKSKREAGERAKLKTSGPLELA